MRSKAPTPPLPSIDARAYRVNDFCRLYGVGRSSAYRLIQEGKLPSVVIAGRRVIPHEAAEALLRSGEQRSGLASASRHPSKKPLEP